MYVENRKLIWKYPQIRQEYIIVTVDGHQDFHVDVKTGGLYLFDKCSKVASGIINLDIRIQYIN
ncbi:hypothetical protein Hanom_Chr13g01204481 [Helianthus anomalus]